MSGVRIEEKDIEVIAEKSRMRAYLFLAMAVLGVAVAAAGVIIYLAGGYKTVDAGMQAAVISLTSVGAVLLIVFTALFIRQLYGKYSLITLKDGELTFPDGSKCKPDEITAVERDKAKDKITVSVSGKSIVISGIANCDRAYKKLSMLAGTPVDD